MSLLRCNNNGVALTRGLRSSSFLLPRRRSKTAPNFITAKKATFSTTSLNASNASNNNDGTAASPGFLSTLFDRYSIPGQQRRIELGERLFRAAQRRATDPTWHTHGQVDTVFRPRHSLLTLHVWLLHRRLLLNSSKQANALLLQEELFEILWHDTKSRIRAAGIQELMLNKHLKDVQNISFQMCLALDHAMDIVDDSKRQRDDVGLILWTHVYLSNEDIEDETVDKVAEYVIQQYENICYTLPDEYWAEGRIGWVPIPDFGRQKVPIEQVQEVLSPGWYTALTDAGETYYWNELTMKSSWERPASPG